MLVFLHQHTRRRNGFEATDTVTTMLCSHAEHFIKLDIENLKTTDRINFYKACITKRLRGVHWLLWFRCLFISRGEVNTIKCHTSYIRQNLRIEYVFARALLENSHHGEVIYFGNTKRNYTTLCCCSCYYLKNSNQAKWAWFSLAISQRQTNV